MRDTIWTDEVRGGVVRHHMSRQRGRTEVHHKSVPNSENLSIFCRGMLDVVDLVARMRGAEKLLGSRFRPTHRPTKLARQQRDEHVFRIQHGLHAESTADI